MYEKISICLFGYTISYNNVYKILGPTTFYFFHYPPQAAILFTLGLRRMFPYF